MSDVQGQGVRDFLFNPFGIRDNWRLTGDGKSSQPTTPVASTRDRMDTAIANALVNQQNKQAQTRAARLAPTNESFSLGNLEGLTGVAQGSTAARNAQNARSAQISQENAIKNALGNFARANSFNTDRFRTGATPGLDASIDFGVAPQQKRTPTNFGQPGALDLSALEFPDPNAGAGTPPPPPPLECPVGTVPDGKGGCTPVGEPVGTIICPLGTVPDGAGGCAPDPNFGGTPVVGDTIRSLYGELSTRDFTDMLRNMMAEREANLLGLNKQSVDQLAASVLRRTGQIGDIKTALETELGVLDADRAGVQQDLVDAVAARAQQMQADTEVSLVEARAGLGDQVTDEFEKVAQIVASQAGSQATSSQDAMARLAQVADMAAAERLAAPAQLASEAELALGDEEFAYTQSLQQNLSEALAGLDAEESERILEEAMRQENFNINRDQRMIEALVGDLVRKDTQAFQAGQAQLGRDFSADQAQLGRDFSAEQAQLGRDFSAGQSALSRAFSGEQSALSRLFQQSERIASQNFKAEQADIQRAAEETERQIEAEVLAEQQLLEDASDLEVANYYNLPVAVWQQMGASERLAVQNRRVEQQVQAGLGREAFPQGTIQNVQGQYPGVNAEFFMHAEALHGIDNKFATETAEEIRKRRETYLNSLKETDGYGTKGLNQAEVQLIDKIYSDLLLDKEIVNRQNRIDQQLEMSSVGRRR